MIAARHDAERAAWDREVAGAWYGAAFARTDRLRPLEEYLPRPKAPVKPQTEAEVMANVRAWLQMHEAGRA